MNMMTVILTAIDGFAGGTFAIYSLFCRYAKINPIGAVEASDKTLRRYSTSQRRLMKMTKGYIAVPSLSLCAGAHAQHLLQKNKYLGAACRHYCFWSLHAHEAEEERPGPICYALQATVKQT